MLMVVCVACGTEVPKITPDDGNFSQGSGNPGDGSRLKRRWIETDDGAVDTFDWWDSLRKESCAFRSASDGKLRCLPKTGVHECNRRSETVVLFSDTECQDPILVGYRSTNCETMPRIVFSAEEGPCLDGVSVYESVDAVDGVIPKSTMVDGVCGDYGNDTPVSAISLKRIDVQNFVGTKQIHF